MKQQEINETIKAVDFSLVRPMYSTNDNFSSVLSEKMDVSLIKKLDLEVFSFIENKTKEINAEREHFSNTELEMQYVSLFLKNKMGLDSYKDIDLSGLVQLPKELIQNVNFLNDFISLVIDNTDTEVSFADQYAKLPLGLRSNQDIAINLFDFLSGEKYSKNNNDYYECSGVDYVAPKLLKNKDFIEKVMLVNPKAIFGDEFKEVREKFSPKAIKELCNDREVLNKFRSLIQDHEGATYIFMETDPKMLNLDDVLAILEDRTYAVLTRKGIKDRFIGTSKVSDILSETSESMYKEQPFSDAFSAAPKDKWEMRDLLKEYLA